MTALVDFPPVLGEFVLPFHGITKPAVDRETKEPWLNRRGNGCRFHATILATFLPHLLQLLCGFPRVWQEYGKKESGRHKKIQADTHKKEGINFDKALQSSCFKPKTRGAPGGDRTHNLQLRRLTLYPIELQAQNRGYSSRGGG